MHIKQATTGYIWQRGPFRHVAPVLAPEDGKGGGGADSSKSDPVVGSSKGGGDDLFKAAERRAAAAEDKAAALQAQIDKGDAEKKAAAQRKRDKERAAAGEQDKLIAEKDDGIAARDKRIAELEAGLKARLDADIGKLPEAAQKEVELLRDSLSMTKVQELVNLKLEAIVDTKTTDGAGDKDKTTVKKAPPAPGVSHHNTKRDDDHVHPETKQLLRRLSARPDVYAMAEKVIGVPMEARRPDDVEQQLFIGDHRFRLFGTTEGGTMKEVNERDTAVFIDALRTISPGPREVATRETMARLDKLAKDVS